MKILESCESGFRQEIPMPIKTGLLCIPTYDEAAVEAVRGLLMETAAGLVVL